MKKLILLLGCLIGTVSLAICQQEYRGDQKPTVYEAINGADSTQSGYPPIRKMIIGQVDRWWYPKEITIQDQTIYRYKLWAGQDSARLFQPGKDTFEVTMAFRRLNKPIVVPLPDVVTSYDNALFDPIINKYEPPQNLGTNIFNQAGWNHFANQSWNVAHHMNTASFLNKAGYVEFEWTGYKIEWYSEKLTNHGIVNITIDNGQVYEVDLYAPGNVNNSMVCFTSPVLPNGPHRIRISWTGKKNPSAQADNFVHDRFVTYYNQNPPSQIVVPASQLIEENSKLKAEIERLKKGAKAKKSK